MSNKHHQRGFSIVELMIVIMILVAITGGIFKVMTLAMQRSYTEQIRLDMFQEARQFVDQMTRDVRQAGYPTPRNLAESLLTVIPAANDPHTAVGLVQVTGSDLWFEADVDQNGTVSVVHYHLDPSTTNNCPCLRRSQLQKITGNPFTGQNTPVYQVEVQDVLNANIFSAFTAGSAVTLPATFNSNGATIASMDTIQVTLTVRSPRADPQTRQKPVTTLVSSVKVTNCSQAATGQKMSCQ